MSSEWVELKAFLAQGTIRHPTQILWVQVCQKTGITLRLRGANWWTEGSSMRDNAEYEFRFTGIKDASLGYSLTAGVEHDISEAREDLEEFEHDRLSNLPWGQGETEEIYCSAALPDPMSLLVLLDSELDNTGCPYDSSRYLNCGGSFGDSFGDFLRISSNHVFKLGSFRGSVLSAVKNELKAQSAPFSTQPSYAMEMGVYFTRFGDSFILSDTALARIVGGGV